MDFVPALIASIAKILICRGDTPIMWASTCNDLPAVKLLLKVLMASVQICYLRWWYHFCMRTTVILTYAGHAKLTNIKRDTRRTSLPASGDFPRIPYALKCYGTAASEGKQFRQKKQECPKAQHVQHIP